MMQRGVVTYFHHFHSAVEQLYFLEHAMTGLSAVYAQTGCHFFPRAIPQGTCKIPLRS
jgi:hypothetical protein